MRRIWLILSMLGLLAAPVLAQRPGQGPGMQQRQQLQQEIMQRFTTNYRESAGLTDEQFEQFRGVTQRTFEQRAQSQQRERDLWVALEGQMRPGVAADTDSLTTLMNALFDMQAERVEHARAAQAEYAEFLSPVQQAQLMLATRRFMFQIEGVRRRMMQGQDRLPGMP
jgi:hypothetical protein